MVGWGPGSARICRLGPQRFRVRWRSDAPVARTDRSDLRLLLRRRVGHCARAALAVSQRIQEEDIAICESVQRGLQSRAYSTGRLSVRREEGEHLVHQLLHADLSAGVTPEMARGHLLRVLGVGFGLAVIIGNTIGAGILRAPGEVAAHLPSVPLFLAA
jgi:hypothetical protein